MFIFSEFYEFLVYFWYWHFTYDVQIFPSIHRVDGFLHPTEAKVWHSPNYFCFCCLCFWCQIQKVTAKIDFKELTTYVFSGSFIVSALMFKFLIYFELIFMCDERWWSSFFLLYETVQVSQHHFEETVFSPLCMLAPSV